MEVIKGRMYDYNNGRFLSVDPFIQSPTSTQSMNPYTYIFNNPLSGVDPTGYRGSGEKAAAAGAFAYAQITDNVDTKRAFAYTAAIDGESHLAVAIAASITTEDGHIADPEFVQEIAELSAQGKTRRKFAPKNIKNTSKPAKVNGNKNKNQTTKKPSGNNISSTESQNSVNKKEPVKIGKFLEGDKRNESRGHANEAKKKGCCMTGTIDRKGAAARRKENLKGVETVRGKDRDEFPPAVIKPDNPNKKTSVKTIDSSDNRSSGSGLGHEINGLPDGTKVEIVIPEEKLKK